MAAAKLVEKPLDLDEIRPEKVKLVEEALVVINPITISGGKTYLRYPD